MTNRIIAFAFLICTAFSAVSCKSVPPAGGPITNVPAISGIIDCAAPSMWKSINLASLLPLVQRAIAQREPIQALDDLLNQYLLDEMTCAVAYVHDASTKQKLAASSNEDAARRVDVTAAWLARHKEITPTNFAGTVQ